MQLEEFLSYRVPGFYRTFVKMNTKPLRKRFDRFERKASHQAASPLVYSPGTILKSMPNCLFGIDFCMRRTIWMVQTTSHLVQRHSYFITNFYDDIVLDSKTDDFKQF